MSITNSTINQLSKKVEELEKEDQIGKGDSHRLTIQWEGGEHVVTWLMRGPAFARVVPDNDSHLMTEKRRLRTMNDEELDKTIEQDRIRFNKKLDQEFRDKWGRKEPLLDPNRFPEGSPERELKEAYMVDEAARKRDKEISLAN